MITFNHYIRTDSDNKILYGYTVENNGPPEQRGDILLRSGAGFEFSLFDNIPTSRLVNEFNIPLYQWDPEQTMVYPRDPEIIARDGEGNLSYLRDHSIARTKETLETVLETPMPFKGGVYTVTADKQNLLSAQLGLFMINSQIGVPQELSWNEAGKECVPWTFENLVALINTMNHYIKPLVSAQQSVESAILRSSDPAEITNLMLDFETSLESMASEMRTNMSMLDVD